MGPRERREREREEIRTLILDAARELFASEGVESVTMRRIAERIEYSPTAIYFHFRDKEALLAELCDADFRVMSQQFTAIATIEDPIERLRATGHAYVEFGLNNPSHYRVMFMTPKMPAATAEAKLRKGNPEEDAYEFLKLTIAQAIREGRFRGDATDPDLMAQIIWSGVHGVVSLEIAKCNDDWVDWRPVRERAKLMIEVLIDGVAKQKE
ncbi:MAG TPA: TetR/AcrR family transcriptional regulator [Thermoanaerobaculia bacterium]|nr:TetR/AcrR family transcriptional regulator [Thermoanaerobaculia bacterium]